MTASLTSRCGTILRGARAGQGGVTVPGADVAGRKARERRGLAAPPAPAKEARPLRAHEGPDQPRFGHVFPQPPRRPSREPPGSSPARRATSPRSSRRTVTLTAMLQNLNRLLVEYQGVVALVCFVIVTAITVAAWLWPRG